MIYPKDVVQRLDILMTGQSELKDALAVIFCKQYLKFEGKIITEDFISDRLLIIGESGTGKTHSLKCLNKILENVLQFIWVPTSEFTGSGWYGKDLSSLVGQVERTVVQEIDREIQRRKETEALYNNEFNDKNITRSVIISIIKTVMYRIVFVFDEFDKVFSSVGENDSKSKLDLQSDFLKFIEDYPAGIKYKEEIFTVNLSDTVMVFLGVFDGLNEKLNKKAYKIGFEYTNEDKKSILQNALVEFGFRRELIARISMMVNTDRLTEEELYQIVRSHPYIEQIKKEFCAYNVFLILSENFYKDVIKNCIENKEGARGILRILQGIFVPLFRYIESLPETLTLNSTKVEISYETIKTDVKYIGQRL